MPAASFSFEAYGIAPISLVSRHKQEQEVLLQDVRARSQRSTGSPSLLLSASFQGSAADKPNSFKESFLANFKTPEDWKPLLSLGLSVSTSDIGAAVHAVQDARLEAALLASAHSAQNASARVRYEQLLALQKQYESFMQSQKTSLDEVTWYYNDMASLAARGALDAMELAEVGLLLAELQSEAAIVYAHWLETVLRARLF